VKVLGRGSEKLDHKWTIKVFAANGLMRASAWATAWSEMERVDVEILPYIDAEMRSRLDARMEEKELQERVAQEAEDNRAQELMESRLILAQDQQRAFHMSSRPMLLRSARSSYLGAMNMADDLSLNFEFQTSASPRNPEPLDFADPGLFPDTQLPPVYRPADIPLSTLMKNYVYLLAQDRRNVALFILSIVALWMSLRAATVTSPPRAATAVLDSTLDSLVLMNSIVHPATVVPLSSDVLGLPVADVGNCRDALAQTTVRPANAGFPAAGQAGSKSAAVLQSPVSPLIAPTECAVASAWVAPP